MNVWLKKQKHCFHILFQTPVIQNNGCQLHNRGTTISGLYREQSPRNELSIYQQLAGNLR